jgi:hypothetical protein
MLQSFDGFAIHDVADGDRRKKAEECPRLEDATSSSI